MSTNHHVLFDPPVYNPTLFVARATAHWDISPFPRGPAVSCECRGRLEWHLVPSAITSNGYRIPRGVDLTAAYGATRLGSIVGVK